MQREQIQEKIHQGIKARLDPEQAIVVTDESRFEEDLAIDSMEIIELLFDAEEVFNIDIADEAVREFRAVGDVIDYIFENQPDNA